MNENRKKPHRPVRQALYALICLLLAIFFCGYLLGGNDNLLVNRPNSASASLSTGMHTDYTLASAGTKGLESADESAWCLVLVNRWNYMPEDYAVELIELSNGQSVDARIYSALQEMFDAARGDGVYHVVVSGYRTAEKQQRLMEDKIADYRAEGYSGEEAMAKAEAWVAAPGTSEHQLGIAVDINADGIHSAGHEAYAWLEQNAYKYGFIRRYPPDKTEITGVINEPWHHRYVGVEAAAEIQCQGMCLEEYLNGTN